MSSQHRPSSAGATRRPSGSGGSSSGGVKTSVAPAINVASNLYGYGGGGGSSSGGGASGTAGKSQQRPSSAGHSRPTSNYAGAQYGHILGQSISSRIASVNTAAAAAMANGQHMYAQYPVTPAQQAAQAAAYAAYSGATASGSGAAYARPKSAGTSRPSGSSSGSGHNVAGNTVQVGGSSGATSYATLQQQQQYYLQQQQQQQQQQQRAAAAAAQYGYGSTTGSTSAGSTSGHKPSSSNAAAVAAAQAAAAAAAKSSAASATNAEQWNNAYKMHYGYASNAGKPDGGGTSANNSTTSAGAVHKIPTIVTPAATSAANAAGYVQKTQAAVGGTTQMPAIAPPPSSTRPASAAPGAATAAASATATATAAAAAAAGPTPGLAASDAAAIGIRASRPSSASATTRIRVAIDESQKYASGGGAAAAGAGADADDDFDEADDGVGMLDAKGEGGAVAAGDDEEMDGKQIGNSATRSHPEVSTATPSMDFGQQSLATGSATEMRNGSMDSLQEEHLNVGLSTVPNQFCSAREAMELKKLLILSKGARGGIVPSSTAVMDMYMVGKVVGVGSYGKVRAAWHRLTGSKVAIKTYDKAKLKDPAHWKRVHSEIKIMEQVSHPRIARMYEAVETPKRMHLIMECLDGGNLCSYVKAKRRLSEEESTRIFFQILQAIEHLHLLGVTHRDVKLENVLFIDPKDCKDIKLIDFGFSTVCQPGKKLKVFCGTPSYMAPEIVQRLEYEGKAVDMWSMGILMYALLCGCFPFRAKSYPDLYRRIARGTFQIPDELSMSARDLLRQLLDVDPVQRMTASAAMRHPWLAKQLAAAGDMNKLRLETTILISDRPADDIDDQVLAEIDTFGFTKDEIVRLVMTKTHSSIATLYYLLMDHIVGKRRMNGGPKRPQSSMNSTAHHGPTFGHGHGHGHGSSGATSKGYQGPTVTPGSMGATTSVRPSSAYAGAPSQAHARELNQHANYQQYVIQQPQMQQQYHQQMQQQQQAQQQQQQQADAAARLEYAGGSSSGRPRSASNGRPTINTQRPLSAYLLRR